MAKNAYTILIRKLFGRVEAHRTYSCKKINGGVDFPFNIENKWLHKCGLPTRLMKKKILE